MAAAIASDELKRSVADILKDADLAQLSSKKVRKQLEAKFGCNMTDRKKEIDGMVMEYIEKNVENGAESEPEDGKKPDEKEADKSDASNDSDFEPPEDEGAPIKKKAQRKKSSDDDDEADDEKLAQELQEKEDGVGRRTRKGPKKPAATKRKSTGGDGDAKPKKNKYSEELMLSPELADVMGTDKMARSAVVKRMWEIVKERNLQDPKNRQFMICDEQLMKIFKRKKVRTFGMMKFLSKHILKPEEYEDRYGEV